MINSQFTTLFEENSFSMITLLNFSFQNLANGIFGDFNDIFFLKDNKLNWADITVSPRPLLVSKTTLMRLKKFHKYFFFSVFSITS